MKRSFSRAFIILNPAAHHGRAAAREPEVRRLFDGAIGYELAVTDAPWHAEALARKAARQILRGKTKLVDAGVCNGTIFTGSVGIGLDGRVSHRATEMKEHSPLSGFPLYFAALIDVLRHDYGGHRVRLAIDGGDPVERPLLMMAITHGFTYGGGFRITPQAVNGDGLFDYCIIDDMPLADALWRVPFVVAGKHNGMKRAATGRATHIRIEADEELFTQLDGEPCKSRHFDLRVLPGMLTAVVGDGRVA